MKTSAPELDLMNQFTSLLYSATRTPTINRSSKKEYDKANDAFFGIKPIPTANNIGESFHRIGFKYVNATTYFFSVYFDGANRYFTLEVIDHKLLSSQERDEVVYAIVDMLTEAKKEWYDTLNHLRGL